MRIYPFALLAFAVLLTSCGTTQQLYNWKGYDDAVYAYTKNSDEKSIAELKAIYNKLINQPDGLRRMPPPGVCADYGYLLIKEGEVAKGKELLNKEIALYPESRPFIERILKRLEK